MGGPPGGAATSGSALALRTTRSQLEWPFRLLVGWTAAAALWRPGRAALREGLAARERVVLVRIDNRVGEALLTTPLVQALAAAGKRVELVVHPSCVRVVEGLPGLQALHVFDRARPLASLGALRRVTPGAVVVNAAPWDAYSGTAALVSRLIAPSSPVVGPAVGPARALCDVPVPARDDTVNEVLQRLHYLSALGVAPGGPRLAFREARPTRGFLDFRRTLGQRVVVVNPGSRLAERRVDGAVFAAAARAALEAGAEVVVTWGPGEVELAREVAAAAPGSRLAPPTTLDDWAALVGLAVACVCNNTGNMHLAVAVGTWTLGLFRAMPMARWGHGPPHHMLDVTGLPVEEASARACAALTAHLEGPPGLASASDLA